MYGPAYPCPFEKYCWEGQEPPQVTPEAIERIQRDFSHSRATQFIRCPEKDRLSQLVGYVSEEDQEEDNVRGPGIVFHRAMEAIYNQLRTYQGTSK
jgi:hypothetical protein